MNEHNHTNDADDKISHLYKQGSTETPSEQINRDIIILSRRDFKSPLLESIKSIISIITFSKPLAFTAVLVISVSIILQLQFEQATVIKANAPLPLSDMNVTDTATTISNDITETTADSLAEESFTHRENRTSAPSASKAKKSAVKETAQPLQRHNKVTITERSEQLSKKQTNESHTKTDLMESYSEAEPQRSQTDSHRCLTLSQSDCLLSINCTLRLNNQTAHCAPSENHCEKNFMQLTDPENKCLLKKDCRYIKSDCLCDDEGHCQCNNNLIPGCMSVTEK